MRVREILAAGTPFAPPPGEIFDAAAPSVLEENLCANVSVSMASVFDRSLRTLENLEIIFFFSEINECEKNPCGKNAVCRNTVGSFTCSCKPEYTGDPYRGCVGESSAIHTERFRFIRYVRFRFLMSMIYFSKISTNARWRTSRAEQTRFAKTPNRATIAYALKDIRPNLLLKLLANK